MFRLCILALSLATTSFAFAQTDSSATTTEAAPEVGPTLPLIKEVQNSEEFRFHLGFNLGINIPEGSRGATPELGFDIGFQPLIPFGLGLEISTSRFDDSHDAFHRRTTALVRSTYNFGGDIPVIKYSYLGFAAGPVFLSDGTEFGFAPIAGFDVRLSEEHNCSLGFVTKYLFVTSKDPDSLMTSAAVKFWL